MLEKLRRFTNSAERESGLRIKSRELIGHGYRGNVYRVRVIVSDETGRKKERPFVLKDYVRHENETKELRELATFAVKAHELLRALKIRTWTTFRISPSKRSILMTDGELEEGDNVITHNSYSESKQRTKGKTSEVVNFEEAFRIAAKEAVIAARNGIHVNDHVWMAKVRTNVEAQSTLTLFMGDLDNIYKKDWVGFKDSEPQEVIENNLHELRYAALALLRDCLKPEDLKKRLQEYSPIIDRLIQEAKAAQ